MIKRIVKSLIKNPSLRNFFNLPWNVYYDVTFHDIAKDYNEAKLKIDNHSKFKNLEDTYLLINKEIQNLKNIEIDLSQQHTLIPTIISVLNQTNNKIDNILDIGGGVHPVSLYIKKYCNIEIQSSVLETIVYTKKLNDIVGKKFDFIKYYSDLNDLDKENFDLVFFGSVIQYFEDKEYDVFRKTISYNPKIIVISHNFYIDEDEDLYSLQTFGRKNLIPHKFFSHKKIVNFFNDQKFKLILDLEHENPYIHKKIDNRNFKNKSLIFVKQN